MLFSVNDLHVRYGAYEAVRGVSFSLDRGEILGIVGESGSGKSTIAKTLIGLEKPSSGTIRYTLHGDATSVASAPASLPNVQMVFQDAVGSLNPRMKIGAALREVLKVRGNHEDSPESLLSLVGLSAACLDQYPRELSGGQCQRISVARALACRPEVLIADEPVSALDVSVQARLLNLFRELRERMNLAILLIAHDLAVVRNICDRICVMEKGVFVDAGEADEVFAHPESDYTKRLLAAVPRI